MPSTVANYPDGVGTAGPTINRLMRVPTEYQVDRFQNEDGGADVNVQPCGIRRWQIEYDGLTAAEVITLRSHFNTAKGKVNNFSFYDRQAATTYSGVQYESFRTPRHLRTWSNPVSVVLVKFI